ncbi:DedA family protein [Alkalicoccobacillus porphyridii]|nr:DedA family protein [Alkalicoccobacillus porphyridii]
MDGIAQLVHLMSGYGYVALFICCAIGLFLFPVPNEVLLMIAGGLVASTQLEAVSTFVTLYMAILLHGTIWYMVGVIIHHLTKQGKQIPDKWKRAYNTSRSLVNRHGHKALFISYFLPFIRHAVPLGVGASSISFISFAVVAFSTAAIWLTIYYLLGFYFIHLIDQIQNVMEHIGFIVIFGMLLSLLFWWRKIKKDSVSKEVLSD